MKPEDVLLLIIEKLERYGINYMITGSFASNLHGVPRATFDADIVIDSNLEIVRNFLKEIQQDFYTDIEMVKEAFDKGGMFNELLSKGV